MTPAATPLTPDAPSRFRSAEPVSLAEIQRVLRRAGGATSTIAGGHHRPLNLVALGDEIESIVVVNAHAGAGASTVALALADEAARTRSVQVIEWCHPSRSGLAAASSRELGVSAPGWLRGTRGPSVVIDRPRAPDSVTHPESDVADCLRVFDVSDPMANIDTVTAIVVCRLSIPGLLSAEAALARLPSTVALAVIGSRRWPVCVSRSVGPRVDAFRVTGRVVALPFDRRLAITGLTPAPLPRPLRSAAQTLLDLANGTGRADSPQPTVMKKEFVDER